MSVIPKTDILFTDQLQAVSAISSVGLSLNCKQSYVPSRFLSDFQFPRVYQFFRRSDLPPAAQFPRER
jgi:hypothetical protein